MAFESGESWMFAWSRSGFFARDQGYEPPHSHAPYSRRTERAGRSPRPAGGSKRFRPHNPTQLVSLKTLERETAPPEPSRLTAAAHPGRG